MQECYADLHIHTNVSDGFISPAELVIQLKNAGVKHFAITDHDAVAGIDEAVRRSKIYGLNVVPGVELSAEYNKKDLHILGYFINHHNKRFLDYLYLFKRRRFQRAQEMVELLVQQGIKIDLKQVTKLAGNGPLGRPHIADALIKLEVVGSRNEAFEKFLHKGGSIYVEKYRITVKEVIELIHSVGGAAFLAHPGLDADENIISELVDVGLDGIETVHSKHTVEMIDQFTKIAEKFSLLTSGGSDFHGDPEDNVKLGEHCVSEDVVKNIENYCIKHRDEWVIDDADKEDI